MADPDYAAQLDALDTPQQSTPAASPQDYAAQLDALDTQPVAPITYGPSSDLAGYPPAVQQQIMGNNPATLGNPANQSWLTNLTQGIGNSIYNTGMGTGQLALQLGQKLGITSPEALANLNQELAAHQTQAAPLMATGAGKVGNVIGQGLQSAFLPGGIFAQGLYQGGLTALQPNNSLTGRAISGATAVPLAWLGAGVGKGLSYLGQPFTQSLGDTERGYVDTLTNEGVDLSAAQATGSPAAVKVGNLYKDSLLSGTGDLPTRQADQWTTAVSKRIGLPDNDTLDADAFNQAKNQIKTNFDSLANNNPVSLRDTSVYPNQPTKFSTDLDAVQSAINTPNVMTSADRRLLNNEILRLKRGADPDTGVINPQVWRSVRTKIGDMSSQGGDVSYYGGLLGHAMDDGFGSQLTQRNVLDPASNDYALWQQTLGQNKALDYVQRATNPTTGKVDPGALIRVMKPDISSGAIQKNPVTSDLYNLAQAGSTILPNKIGAKAGGGLIPRLVGQAVLGAGVGAGDEFVRGKPKEAIELGLAAGLAPAVARSLSEGFLSNAAIRAANSPLMSTLTRGLVGTGAAMGARIPAQPVINAFGQGNPQQ
jgi:hypothetical protein